MKIVFKSLVLAAVMSVGLQAQAAITCSVTVEGKIKNEYTEAKAVGVFNLSEEESAVMVGKDGYPLVLKGLSFAVHKGPNALSVSAFYNGSMNAEAIALSENGKQTLLILAAKGIAFACQDSAK